MEVKKLDRTTQNTRSFVKQFRQILMGLYSDQCNITKKNEVPFCTMCEFKYNCMRFWNPTPKLIYCLKNKCYYQVKDLSKNVEIKKKEGKMK